MSIVKMNNINNFNGNLIFHLKVISYSLCPVHNTDPYAQH